MRSWAQSAPGLGPGGGTIIFGLDESVGFAAVGFHDATTYEATLADGYRESTRSWADLKKTFRSYAVASTVFGRHRGRACVLRSPRR